MTGYTDYYRCLVLEWFWLVLFPLPTLLLLPCMILTHHHSPALPTTSFMMVAKEPLPSSCAMSLLCVWMPISSSGVRCC